MKFSWDPNKSALNKEKHGVDFTHAKDVFEDGHAIVGRGETVAGEERWIAIGKTMKLFIIAVVFTIRDATIRIISARQARKNEIREYISNSFNRITMATAMKTAAVLELIGQGKPVNDIVLQDIEDLRLNFKDAMLLIEHGFLITQKNLLYQEGDIAYDMDFDEVKWEKSPKISLDGFLKEHGLVNKPVEDVITIELSIHDHSIRDWLKKNTDKLKDVVNKLVVDLYHTDKMLHSE